MEHGRTQDEVFAYFQKEAGIEQFTRLPVFQEQDFKCFEAHFVDGGYGHLELSYDDKEFVVKARLVDPTTGKLILEMPI